jgi:hypothetical protein
LGEIGRPLDLDHPLFLSGMCAASFAAMFYLVTQIRSLASRPQPMRYTKIALLTFGAGLLLGLVVVVIEIDLLDRLASGLMALGLAAIPIGLAVDWRLATKTARQPPPKARRKAPARRTAAAPRNPPPRRTAAAPRNPPPRRPAPPKR